jgi:choline-sulfatase
MTVSRPRRHPTTAPRPEAPSTRRRIAAPAAALAALAIAGVGAWAFWSRPAPTTDASRPPLNVLLVTLDTTRADHVGAYGYARARTPRLDRLAAEGVRFDRAISPAPITLPAHASILTGLYPFRHGVRNNGNFYLADRFDTLATVLASRGYDTAAFVSSFVLDRRYGLARGFQTYDDRMEGAGSSVLELEAERRGDRTALALLAWLDRHASTPSPTVPFFAWLHLYDPHEPYHAPAPFGPAFSDAPYDGEIAFDDAILASVIDKLRSLGELDRTVIAVIGDHGESLGEHGEETHTMFVYESAVRVPMIVWRPGVVPSGVVVAQRVRAVDLAPTLLNLVGAPPLGAGRKDGRPDGVSLVPLFAGTTRGELPPAYAETLLPQLYMNWAPLRALSDDRWKLVDAPRPELYDLQADPGELRNLFDQRRQTAEALQRRLQEVTRGQDGDMSVGKMDRETLEKLASLGYIGAGAEAGPVQRAADAVDPKDMIAVFNQLRLANAAVRERRFSDAESVLRVVLKADPRNAFARLVLGSALMGKGDYRAAVAEYRRYVELVPTSSYAHQWMAICELRAGDPDAAVREAEAALAIDPHFTDARVLKAGVLAGRGDYARALPELAQAVKDDPAKPQVRLDYAKVLEESGHADEAASQFGAALEIDSTNAGALAGLGALYARQGRLDAARAALTRALAAHPDAAEARFNLAKVLEQQGDATGALAEYRRLADDPQAAVSVKGAARQRISALAGRRMP